MAELIRVNKKIINDPLYTPVIAFLKARIRKLEEEGPEDQLDLARRRYNGIVAGDLVIENPVTFPDGTIRVCFVSRNKGFARVDVDIAPVSLKDILEDFQVPMVEIEDTIALKAYVKANPTETTLLWLKWQNKYGVLLNQDKARTIDGPMEAFGGLFFEDVTTTRESLTSIDYESLESGTVTISDLSFGTATFPLFIYELVLDEADIPEITSNLPTEITTRRGESFSIPNTYLFGGEDITLSATVELTTGSGYTIPRRSPDLINIDGETIFGSSTDDVTDEIVVRIIYTFNGREVRKTFRIKVVIEKDQVSDLTITTTPNSVSATRGDVIEVVISAALKGAPVEILTPPQKLKSNRDFGDLNYVRTNADNTMVYRGAITGSVPPEQDKLTDLYSAAFLYNDNEGNAYRTMGYLNLILVKPGKLPEFKIKLFTSSVTGYVNDTGRITVAAYYGDTKISATELGITTGIKGGKQLIRYTKVDDDGIDFTLIADSGIPGTPTVDTFNQLLSWRDPNGIYHTDSPVVEVTVKKRSVIEVLPVTNDPIDAVRYQQGRLPFKVMVNGVDKTSSITGFKLKSNDEYLSTPAELKNTWIVVNAGDELVENDTTFTFKLEADGEVADYDFTKQYNIAPWTPSGFNTNIAISPLTADITGDSDSGGSFSFKVFEGVNDITANAVVLNDRTVVPDNVTFQGIAYNASTKSFVLNYYKDKGTQSTGDVYVTKAGLDNPTDDNIGHLPITANVGQSKILKLISVPSVTRLDVEVPGSVPIELEFSGKKLKLNDPNLSYVLNDQPKLPDTTITGVNEDTIDVVDNFWRFVGNVYNDRMTIEWKYIDTSDNNKEYKLTTGFTLVVTFPPMEIQVTGQPINAKIWDAGRLPVKLVAGTRDWTSAIKQTDLISTSAYVAIAGLDWNIYNAQIGKPTSVVIGVKFKYTVNQTEDQTLTADFQFNIAEWDGITFAITSLTPTEIDAASGDTGDIAVKLVYKGKDVSDTAVYQSGSSSIPETITLGTPTYDSARGRVFPYTTKRGGDYNLVLAFKAPGTGTETTKATIQTKVTWPHDLNIVNSGVNMNGYWQDQVTYPLVINFSGVPLDLTDPTVEVTFSSGTDDPVKLEEVKADALVVLLDKGGALGTNNNYTGVVTLKYTDPSDGKVWTKQINVPSTIRVSDVKVGFGGTERTTVYARGEIKTTLFDERSRDVPITSYAPNGTGNYVAFETPKNWYVSNGIKGQEVDTQLPVTLGFDMGGSSHTLDVDVPFVIAKWDGVKYRAITSTEEIEGKAGFSDELQFDFTWLGDSITGSTLDKVNSIIPPNVVIGELSSDGKLPYTLVGQGDDTLKLIFLRPGGSTPAIPDVDSFAVSIAISSVSSDEEFSVVNSDPAISLDWGTTGVLNVALKYGAYNLKANSPGISYTVKDSASDSVVVAGVTANGVVLKAVRSNVAGSVDVYPEDIVVAYEVGAPTPKTADINVDVTISMGQPSIMDDGVVEREIWDRGFFTQGISFNGVKLNRVISYDLQVPDNKYIEVTQPRGYEIIGAEPTTQTQSIPMTLYYKVDATDDVQSLNFLASFKIAGSTSVRFTVPSTPKKIEGLLDEDIVLQFTPLYKDQEVGANATFKEDLSTFPPQVVLKEWRVQGSTYFLTFTGKKAGIGNVNLVFWSPDAGTDPKARDIWQGTIESRIMGEPGIEIGTRDNLLVGKHNDTGTYQLEVLFGGLPIDMVAEMSKGNLTVTAEKVSNTSTASNASVFNIVKINPTSLDYKLTGPVAPGQTVDVSDFVNIVYTFGTQTYSNRVEIPLRYTTSAPTINSGVGPFSPKMWESQPFTISLSTDGVNITSASPISRVGYIDSSNPPKYVHLTGAVNWVLENAETTAQSNVVQRFRFFGQYRNWVYQLDADTTFNLPAWDGKTFIPTLTGNFNGYPDGTSEIKLAATFKNGNAVLPGVDMLDRDKTDLKGLVSLAFARNETTFAVYQVTGLKEGTDTLDLVWRRSNSDVPGVVDYDFASTPLSVVVKADKMIGSGGNVSGGNADKRSAPMTVKRERTGLNIPLNTPGLTITPVDETVFRITDVTASTLNIVITAPLNTPLGAATVPLNIEYIDPNSNKTITGQYDYPVTIQRPDDWPQGKVLGPYFDAQQKVRYLSLWDYGPIPYTVTVSGVDVTNQCTLVDIVDSVNPPYVVKSVDYPVPGTWWQVINAGTSIGQRTVKTVVKAPFRGDFVNVEFTDGWNIKATASQVIPFTGNPSTTRARGRQVGEEYEIPFAFLFRNAPYTKVVFNEGLSTSFTDNLQYLETRVANGVVYLKVKQLKVYSGQIKFVFDIEGESNPVDNQSRTTITSTFYNLTVSPVATQPTWSAWKTVPLTTVFTVKDDTTDVTTNITLTSINDPLFKIQTAQQSTTGPQIRIESEDAFAGYTGNITYKFKMGSAYNNEELQITIPATVQAFDGNHFTASPVTPAAINLPIGRTASLTSSVMYFRTTALNASVSCKVDAGKLEELNPGALTYNGIGPGTSLVVNYTTKGVFSGKLRIPVDYTGPGYDNWPVGTLGKNFIILEQDAIIYENQLFFYPSTSKASAVRGSVGQNVTAACMFSIGRDVAANQIRPNDGNVTWSIPSEYTRLLSLLGTSPGVTNGVRFTINYDNRNADIVTKIPVTVKYSGSFNGGGVGSTITYDQDVTIVGTNTGDTIVATNLKEITGSVWAKGGLPFGIRQNGVDVSTSTYKSITLSNDPYVKPGAGTASNAWEIQDGTTAGIDRTITFTVVYNDGYQDRTFVQDVIFHINPYNGIDLVANVVNPDAFNNGITAVVNGTAQIRMGATYKGTTLNNATSGDFGIWDSKTTLPGFTLPKVSDRTDTTVTYNATYKAGASDMASSSPAVIYFGLKAKENDPTAVEGKDFVKLNFSSYVYIADKYYGVSGPTAFSAKFTDGEILLPFVIRQGITQRSLVYGGVPTLENGVNMTLITGAADAATNARVKFASELTDAQTRTTDVVFTFGGTDTTKRARFPVKATQVSGVDYPAVTDLHTVETVLNRSGTLPFKLMDGTTDVTSAATITDISANDYVGLDGTKWRVKNARTGDTTLTVTFTFAITYHGNALIMKQDVTYLVKGYNDNPVTNDVQTVTANVWDKGTVLPFTILISGEAIPASWITGIAGTSVNSRVTAGPAATNFWKVVAGDKTQAVTDTLNYTITVNNGTRSWTVNQTVAFNINKYDGVEFKLVPVSGRSLNALPEGITIRALGNANASKDIYIAGMYKGEIGIGLTHVAVGSASVRNINVAATANNIAYTYIVSDAGVKSITAAIRRTGTTSTQPNDYLNVEFPIVIYADDRYVAVKGTTTISGKLGDVIDMEIVGTTGPNIINLTDPGMSVTFPANSPIQLVPGSLTKTHYKVRFVNDVTAATTTTVQATVANTNGKSVSYNINVTQNPGDKSLKAQGSVPEMYVDDTGNIHITGTYGADPIATHVTLDTANSDTKGLYTFGQLVNNADGSIDIPVTAKTVGSQNVTVRLKSVHTSGTTEGVDYVTVTIPAVVKTHSFSLDNVVSPLTMNLWETKPLQFKVTEDGQDVTASVTDLVPTNQNDISDKFEFVKISNTSWGYKAIKASDTAQTTAQATFDVKVTINGKETVLHGTVQLVTNINDGSIPSNRFDIAFM